MKWLERVAELDQRAWAAVARLLTPRMGLWLLLTLLLLGALWWVAPHMLKVVLYKAVLLTLAAFLGDKVARTIERRNARPHEWMEEAKRFAEKRRFELAEGCYRRVDAIYLRRAIVVGAFAIAAALGS